MCTKLLICLLFFSEPPFDGQLRLCSELSTFPSFHNGWPNSSFCQIAQRTNTKEADSLQKKGSPVFSQKKTICSFLTLKHPQIFHLQMLPASSQWIPNVEEEKKKVILPILPLVSCRIVVKLSAHTGNVSPSVQMIRTVCPSDSLGIKTTEHWDPFLSASHNRHN